MRNKWSKEDKQRYVDGDRLKASSIPSKRFEGPSQDEWNDDMIYTPERGDWVKLKYWKNPGEVLAVTDTWIVVLSSDGSRRPSVMPLDWEWISVLTPEDIS